VDQGVDQVDERQEHDDEQERDTHGIDLLILETGAYLARVRKPFGIRSCRVRKLLK
jgi:hypothetical protein